MKCHYEVLNVARDAEIADIKVAYKKLALKWHPDKNLSTPDEAKEQFQLVQQAYEVLSDRQERAWYDNHRESILRGCNTEFEDNCLDVYQYFTTSCFKGYGDDDNSFYGVYRKVFEEIAKEDMEYMENKDDFCKIPMFGTSTSDYESVVGQFYNYWLSYSTKKSYAWLDPYNINETRERRVLKIIEKENKKIRVKAKKERNEEVRNLVMFVRKRDKRVQAYNKLHEAKLQENKKKSELNSKQRRLDRMREINESSEQAEWTKFDNVKSELEEIEKNLAKEFSDYVSEESDEEDDNNLYCVACNKLFKTPKAFQNHESSKKHKENVERLKETLLEEEEEFNLTESQGEEDIEDISDCGAAESQAFNVKNGSLSLESEDEDNLSSKIVDNGRTKKNKKKKKASKALSTTINTDESESENESEKYSKIDENDLTKKNKKMKKKSKVLDVMVNNDNENVDQEESMESEQATKSKKKQKKSKNVLSPAAGDEEIEPSLVLGNDRDEANDTFENQKKRTTKKKKTNKSQVDSFENNIENKSKKKDANKVEISEINGEETEHRCKTCTELFDSKNKLFEHLKKSGHSVYITKTQNSGKEKRTKVKN